MNRDDILKEFGITEVAQVTIPAEDMADEIVQLRARLAAAEQDAKDVVAWCRGTQMSPSGIRALEKMQNKLAACEAVVSAAIALDRAATVTRLSPDDVKHRYVDLHIALNEYRASTSTPTTTEITP